MNSTQTGRMNFKTRALVSVCVVLAAAVAATLARDYHGYSVIRIDPKDEDHISGLKELIESKREDGIDAWRQPVSANSPVDLLVPPTQRASVEKAINRLGASFETLIEDVGSKISEQRNGTRHLGPTFAYSGGNFREFFTNFQNYDRFEDMILEAAEHPWVKHEVLGETIKGNRLHLVKVSLDHEAKKPVIMIDAGHHAREWVSHTSGMYLMMSALNRSLPVPETLASFLEDFDFWFVPVVNPDGYIYTRSTDRNWRKNRSGNPRCVGVDLNRNYNYHWSGANRNCRTIDYPGLSPLSEAETRAVAEVLGRRRNISMYLSLHSYGQMILMPYGYARDKRPANYEQMKQVAKAGALGFYQLRRTNYIYGHSATVLYQAAGGSDDHAHGLAGVPFSYTIELPNLYEGFLVRASEIEPIGQETIIGVSYMIRKMKEIM